MKVANELVHMGLDEGITFFSMLVYWKQLKSETYVTAINTFNLSSYYG